MWVQLCAVVGVVVAAYLLAGGGVRVAEGGLAEGRLEREPGRAPRSVSGSEALPDYHLMMLNDVQRNDAFEGAIRAAVRGQHVLDIGAGTGLLSMMSARAGAAHVTAVERSPEMVAVAHEVLRLNNWTSAAQSSDAVAAFTHAGAYGPITLLRAESTAVTIGPLALPQPATVLVSETLDTFLIGEAFIPSLLDARRRGLITPDATIIPARATVSMMPCYSAMGFGRSSTMSGFNLEPMRPHRPFRPRGLASDAPDFNILGPPVDVAVFDFQNNDLPKFARIVVRVNQTTVLNSLVLHWVASIDSRGAYQTTNLPRPHRSWAAGLMLLMDDLFVAAGDTVRIDVAIAQTQWAFAARVLPDDVAPPGLEWRRVVVLYESQCATAAFDVYWRPPGDGAPVRVVDALQPWASAAGTTYPGHLFEARLAGTSTVVARYAAADAQNHFVMTCPQQ